MPDDRYNRPPPTLGTVRPGSQPAASGADQPEAYPSQPRGSRTTPPPLPGARPNRPPLPPPLPPRSSLSARSDEPFAFQRAADAQQDADEPQRRRNGFARALTLLLVGLLVLVGGGLTMLAIAPPVDLISDKITTEIKRRTGRDLVINGRTKLKFFPSLGIELSDVTLSAPQNMPGPPLLHAAGLQMRVALLPLITREVTVEQLHLRKPVIDLRIDAMGHRSWDFARLYDPASPGPTRYAQVNPRGPDGKPVPKELQDFAKNASTSPSAKSRLGVNSVALDDVRITGGTLRYSDARQGIRHELTGLEAQITGGQASGPVEIKGSFLTGGEQVAISGRTNSLLELLDERPAKLALKLDAKPIEVRFDGTAQVGQTAVFEGKLAVTSSSLDGLARLLQVPLTGAANLGKLAIDGRLRTGSNSLAMSDANLTLGDVSAQGSFSIDTASQRPRIDANLKIAALDLNQLATKLDGVGLAAGRQATPAVNAAPAPRVHGPAPTLQESPGPQVAPIAPVTPLRQTLPAQAGSGPARSAAPSAPATAPPQSIEDLLKRPQPPAGPAVRGFTRRASDGWSSEPLDATLLHVVDIDARFDIGRIAWSDVKIGPSTSALQLKAGALKLDVPQVELYGGKARGLVTIDAREPTLTIGANLSGDGLSALPLLKDSAQFDVIDGRGRLSVAVSAKGGSERELIGTLSGKADLNLANGAVHGWDAGQMIAGLGQGRIPKPERVPGAKTPFNVLSTSFQIQHGVARTQDIKLESPVLNSTGGGVINLVDRNLNLTLKPKPAAIGGVGGIEIPLRIAGPFDNVTVMPDAGGILRSQPAQEAVKKLKEGDVDGALDKVLGKGTTDEKIERGRNMLKQFLNQR